MYRHIILVVAIFVCLVLGVYFKHFHRLPTEDILAANQAAAGPNFYDDDDDDDEVNEVKRSLRNWDQWIRRNRFVSIGKLFDKCANARSRQRRPLSVNSGESIFLAQRVTGRLIKQKTMTESINELEDVHWMKIPVQIGNSLECRAAPVCQGLTHGDDRIMVGQVVMLEDDVNGGVTSKTYLNVTLQKDVVGGLMYLTCQYNGNDLYSNHWDLCTAEGEIEDRVINCPIRVGRRKFVKELKIPNYLPKGRYTTKAWIEDQDQKTIGCAFAEFTL